MELPIYLAVLATALLHAGWNSAVKAGGDRFSLILCMALVHGAVGLAGLAFAPAPSVDAWPWIAAGALLHVGYQTFLAKSYEHADLSQAYPLARGTAPLLVLTVSALAGAELRPLQVAAVLAISAGILALATRGSAGGAMRRTSLAYALCTAAFIAGYTLVDGWGARIAGTATGYLFWMSVGNALALSLWAYARFGPAAFRALIPVWRTGVGVGVASLAAYWVIVWAFTVAPIALVASLRESSILFATVIGALALGERVRLWRWLSVGLIAAGAVAIRF